MVQNADEYADDTGPEGIGQGAAKEQAESGGTQEIAQQGG